MALGVIGGAIMAVVALFGGRETPWVTPSELQVAVNTQAQITDTLAKLNQNVDRLAGRLDRTDCREANNTYWQAVAALEMDPNNQVAKSLLASAELRIDGIPGCMIDQPPAGLQPRPLRPR